MAKNVLDKMLRTFWNYNPSKTKTCLVSWDSTWEALASKTSLFCSDSLKHVFFEYSFASKYQELVQIKQISFRFLDTWMEGQWLEEGDSLML